MSFQSMLFHKVNLHKLKSNTVSKGYGLPETIEEYYSATPDEVGISCNIKETVKDPQREGAGYVLPSTYKVIFSYSYHNVLQFGDIIVWGDVKIKLNSPTPIKTHHIEVTGVRDDGVKFNGS